MDTIFTDDLSLYDKINSLIVMQHEKILTIEILKETGAGEILLTDLRGIVLGTWPIQNSKDAIKIKIHSIPNGQYIIKMISDNVTMNKLLIINQ